MKTPSFWNKKGIISTLLLPLGWVYSSITNARMSFNKGNKVNIPVICVGNLTAGGTGKTPVSISIAQILKKEEYNPFFVSRGYGGTLKGIIVDSSRHSAYEVGDEPLLLSQEAEVSIDSNRYDAAKLAISKGADVIIMDDGFQNPYLHKDLSFIVVDGAIGFGNNRPIPSGPLRENLKKGLKRAQAIIIIGEDKKNISKDIKDIPIFKGIIDKENTTLKNEIVIAFAGIGRPEKFYTSLKELDANIIETIDFPDHHKYQEKELLEIINKAKENNAKIYTTSKDYIKIPKSLQNNFDVLHIKIRWEDEESLKDFIIHRISNKKA